MNVTLKTLAAVAALSAAALFGCTSDPETGEHNRTEGGEHDRDGGEHGGEGRDEHGGEGRSEEGEESGTELALSDSYDQVRRGARLILAFDAASNSFVGTVENTTENALDKVRVEVHLSNGKELGPTTSVDLAPGEKSVVQLTATSTDFDGWTTHAEVGNDEHGGEARGEHDREVSGEHK